MAALSNAIRLQLWRGIMRLWSRQGATLSGLLKADIQAAINAADDWADSNAASYNSALPTAFRTNATAAHKALLLAMVVLARHDPVLIRAILGEVD
jgi:hypothetical protein